MIPKRLVNAAARDQRERARTMSPVNTARAVTLADYRAAREHAWVVAERETAQRLGLTVEPQGAHAFYVLTQGGKRLPRFVTFTGGSGALHCGCTEYVRAHEVGREMVRSCEHVFAVASFIIKEEDRRTSEGA